MKKVILSVALILTVCVASMGNPVVAQGQSNTSSGDYKIIALEDRLTVNGKELQKYLISYEKPDMKVIVAVEKQENGEKYYVLSGQLPVQYESNGVHFGVRKMDGELLAKGFATSMSEMNKAEFYRQRVLTAEKTGTVDHLSMIAAYYPVLIN